MRPWILALAVFAIGAGAAGPLDLVALDGRPAPLALQEGRQALVVHFWATWCPSCVEELGELDRAAASCRDARVEVVAVNVAEDAETAARYWREHGLALPLLLDPKGDVWRRITGRGLPANLVWTREGRQVDVGPRDHSEWQAELGRVGCRATDD